MLAARYSFTVQQTHLRVFPGSRSAARNAVSRTVCVHSNALPDAFKLACAGPEVKIVFGRSDP